jgi:hypothetical protein
MQIAKLRVADENGLVPAGAYFKQLASGLRDANGRETARRETQDAEDHKLEARHRRMSASRANIAAAEMYL